MKTRRLQRGFTVIELMTVIVILGILAAVGIVQLIYAEGRAKNAVVKSSMHDTQNVIEIYAVDYSGIYPPSIRGLANDPATANAKTILEMENPYSLHRGAGAAYDEESVTPKLPGLVTYESSVGHTKYWVYGYNKEALRIKVNDRDFILSNS